MKRMKVVALNKDAKLIGSFDSISLAAKYLGVTYASLNGRLLKRKPYKQILFVREPEYYKLWMNGEVETLKFPSRKEMLSNRCRKRWSNMTNEKRESILSRMN